MNLEYNLKIEVPLYFKSQQDRAIENNPPRTVSVEVKANGWQLTNLYLVNTTAKCIVDLSRFGAQDSIIELTRNDLIKSIQSLFNAQAIDVYPQSLTLKTGKTGTYSVPILSRVTIIPKKGFTVVGTPEIIPDMVNIKGNDKMVKHIKTWSTELMVIKDINESFISNIPLSDSLKNIVSLEKQSVRLQGDIQQESDMTFFDVDIKIRGGNISGNRVLSRTKINVTIRGGVNIISRISQDQINVYLNADDVNNDSTGIVVPQIMVPQGVKVVRANPAYLYNIRTLNNRYTSK